MAGVRFTSSVAWVSEGGAGVGVGVGVGDGVKVADGVGVTEGVGVDVGGCDGEGGVSAVISSGVTWEGTITKRLITITRTRVIAMASPLMRSRVVLRIECCGSLTGDYTTRRGGDKGRVDRADLSPVPAMARRRCTVPLRCVAPFIGYMKPNSG